MLELVVERLSLLDRARKAVQDEPPLGVGRGQALLDHRNDQVVRRLSGRRVCVKGQHNFHVDFDPPKHPDRCDVDGSRLIMRDDDKPEVVERRLAQYREKTAPLIGYYEKKSILRRIDAARSAEQVHDQIRALIASLKFEE